MTREVVGLVLANVGYLLVGAAALVVAGWLTADRASWFRLGVAYPLGIVVVVLPASYVALFGVPVAVTAIVVGALVVVAAIVCVRRRAEVVSGAGGCRALRLRAASPLRSSWSLRCCSRMPRARSRCGPTSSGTPGRSGSPRRVSSIPTRRPRRRPFGRATTAARRTRSACRRSRRWASRRWAATTRPRSDFSSSSSRARSRSPSGLCCALARVPG